MCSGMLLDAEKTLAYRSTSRNLLPKHSQQGVSTRRRCEAGARDQYEVKHACLCRPHRPKSECQRRLLYKNRMRRALGSSSFEEGPQVGAIDVAAVQQLLQAGDDAAVQLIDVREEEEHATASLPGFQLLPLSRYRATFLTV